MAFFQTKPNLPDAEKARVEFHLQQIVDAIGRKRFQLPVLGLRSVLDLCEAGQATNPVIALAGKHLSHDVSGLDVKIAPQQLEKCGGGG